MNERKKANEMLFYKGLKSLRKNSLPKPDLQQNMINTYRRRTNYK